MQKNNGSALIIVIFITSFLSLASYGFWHKASLFLDIVLKREVFYEHLYLTETMLDYSKKKVVDNFQNFLDLLKSKVKIKESLNYLVRIIDKNIKTNLAEQYNVEMVLAKSKNTNSILLSVNLFDKNRLKKLCCLSCLIQKEAVNEKTKNQFVIKDYNIGPTI